MIARLLARIAVRRPAVLIATAIFLIAASLVLLNTRQSFDSDILNLLPASTPSVEGLRTYNSQFNSANELAFLIETPSGDDLVSEDFVQALKKQPWVLRILDGFPNESDAGRETLPSLIAPLILNQSEEEFEATLSKLEPTTLAARLQRLAAQTAAGSPLARMELINDPTGLIAPAAQILSKKLSIGDTFELVSSDGRARIVPTITNQPTLTAKDCHALMQKVHRFIEDFHKQEGNASAVISVTGRAAYMDEISSSMHRDIFITTTISLLAVTVLFWFAFRSLLPLVGSILILAFTCLLSLAVSSLLFEKLNVIAMGFCSILIGLGDDFSLLLYQRYLGARASGADRESAIADSTRHSAPGIIWVALTTGIGFATLMFSGSAGFAQLGALIAVGVLLSAAGMILFIPLFERAGPSSTTCSDPFQFLCKHLILRQRQILSLTCAVFVVAILLAAIPWHSLKFDTSTHSLEPQQIPAARALARIMEKFPAAFEPLMIVIKGPIDATSLSPLDEKLAELRTRGLVETFSSPSSLVPHLIHSTRNEAHLRALDLDGLFSIISTTETKAGLRPGTLDSATKLITELQSNETLGSRLPSSSPWWFVLDRVFSPSSGDVIYHVRLPSGIERSQRKLVEEEIQQILPQAMVTGWSQMLNDLVPWATRELIVFGSLVISVIFIILLAMYRRLPSLLAHIGTLALALAGTIATLKLAGHSINLLNVLAFPLILAVGVDYGVHLILAASEDGDPTENLMRVMKPVLISGLTTCTGFGALMLARNPALNGLGLVCTTGVAWSLFASLCFLAPLCLHQGISGKRPQVP